VLAFSAAICVVLALRITGIHWGLPNAAHFFSYHPDEIFLLQPSFYFAQGDWNPHFFNYGTLYIYLVGVPAVLLGLVAKADLFPAGLSALYLEGRLITALLGTATVPVLYFALRRESRWLAAISAALLALCPLHVVNSHYATVDVPATFFLAVAFLLALRGSDWPDLKAALALGAAVGLAAATKYTAGLFLLPAVLAPLLMRSARPSRGWWLGVPAGAAAGFLMGCPFVWTQEFMQGLLFELRHAREGGTLAFVGTGSGWGYHLARGLPVGLGFPLLGAAIVGVFAAVRMPSRAARLSLLWVVLYLFLIGFGKERFIRYLVPLTPFICVLAAWGLIGIVRAPRLTWVREAGAGLGLLVLALTGLYAVGQTVPFVLPDARDIVSWQVHSDVLARDSGARVGLAQTPWYFHPPISPFNAGAYSRPWFQQWNKGVGERVVVTGWSAGELERLRPEAFLLSDLESQDLLRLGDRQAVDLVAALDGLYQARIDFSRPPTPFSWLAPGRDWAPPDWLYPSPRITLYYEPRP